MSPNATYCNLRAVCATSKPAAANIIIQVGTTAYLNNNIVEPQLPLLVPDDGVHCCKSNGLLQLVAEPLNNSVCMQHTSKATPGHQRHECACAAQSSLAESGIVINATVIQSNTVMCRTV